MNIQTLHFWFTIDSGGKRWKMSEYFVQSQKVLIIPYLCKSRNVLIFERKDSILLFSCGKCTLYKIVCY